MYIIIKNSAEWENNESCVNLYIHTALAAEGLKIFLDTELCVNLATYNGEDTGFAPAVERRLEMRFFMVPRLSRGGSPRSTVKINTT